MTREEAARILRREIECMSHIKCSDCILEKACDPNTTLPDSEYIEIFEMAIKALEQEHCVGSDECKEVIKAYFDGQADTLDDIKTEIKEEADFAYADFDRYKVEYLGQDLEDAHDSLPQDDFRYGMLRALEIINRNISGK